MSNEKTIDACRDAYNAARKPVEIEAWALHYGLWLMDLAEDGARLRADGELPLAGDAEIVLPEPMTNGDYRLSCGSRIWKSYDKPGKWFTDDGNGRPVYFDTPYAAARALAAMGKGPGAVQKTGSDK